MGVDRRRIPKYLWLQADDVVAQSLRGLYRGQLFVITGWQYQLIVLLAKLLPSRLARAVNRRPRR